MSQSLIIVDMQNDFLLNDGKLALGHDTKELRDRVAKFVKDFDTGVNGVVILTKDAHDADAIEFKTFPAHCVKGLAGQEVVKEIRDALTDRKAIPFEFDKQSYTSVVINSIGSEQAKWGPIHVVGVCTHICVHDVIAGIVNYSKNLYNRIPEIIVHRDMVDDFNPEMAEFALKRLQNLYSVKVV